MEREGNKINVPRVLIALIIAIAVLAFAFMQGYLISFLNYQKVSGIENTLKIDLLETQLSGQLLQNCNENAFALFSNELDESGALISLLEQRFGKTDENVLNQKKNYVLLEVQHFLAVKKYSEECEKDVDFVLFFYSNEDVYGNTAENIGKMLDSIKSQKDREVMIYSFDYDLNMDIIVFMKHLYGVSSPNTVVINEEFNILSPSNINEFSDYFDL